MGATSKGSRAPRSKMKSSDDKSSDIGDMANIAATSSDSVSLGGVSESHVHTTNDGKSYTLFSADIIADTLIDEKKAETADSPATTTAKTKTTTAAAPVAGDDDDDSYTDDDDEQESAAEDEFARLEEDRDPLKDRDKRKTKAISRLTTLQNSNRRNSAEFVEFAKKSDADGSKVAE